MLAARPYLQRVSLDPGARIDTGDYPFSIPAVKNLGIVDFHPDVTFFVGENGAGKSTVLEAIALAMGFGQEGGTINAQSFRTTDSVSPLHQYLKLSKSFRRHKDGYFLRAESFFNIATYLDDIGSPSPSLHRCSHGEAFMEVLTHKLRGQGLYLMDEPEAALSPNRQLAALAAIHQLVQNESQFIIATHSPILLSYPGAKILQFDASGIAEIAYEDTEHFAVTRDFLNHYPRRLQQLFADDD
ncbi:MAG TPA: AAA family ATPase [Burkholderiaceae bacterium]